MIFKTEDVFPGLWKECFSKLVNLISFSHFSAVEQAALMCLMWGQIEKWKRQDLKYVEQLEKVLRPCFGGTSFWRQNTKVVSLGL